MDTVLSIIFGANIISIATGIIMLILFLYTLKKHDFKTSRNYLIGAFVFIVVDPLLIWLLGRSLVAYVGPEVMNLSGIFQ
jgi:hypothetical protein